jgi:hypothetical protein
MTITVVTSYAKSVNDSGDEEREMEIKEYLYL